MKRNMKVIVLLVACLLLMGCDGPIEKEINRESVLEPTYSDDLEEIHEIVRYKELEDFTLVTKYDTIDYDLNKWRIIDNKTIKLSTWTEGLPEGWEAIVEHTHIDMYITNEYEKYPAILQDSMDDKFHGYTQDGFIIADDITYENIFGVNGASDKLHSAVDYSKDYSLQLKDLRENDFLRVGYKMNTMQVVYDVMVKKPGNDFYETIAVYDEIIIPVGYKAEP